MRALGENLERLLGEAEATAECFVAMWLRLLDYLVCPSCSGALALEVSGSPVGSDPSPGGASPPSRSQWIDWGLLLCKPCRTMYPIADGLPVMLGYQTPAAELVAARFGSALDRIGGFTFPAGAPMPGEEFVQRSFSREWAEYDYDGTM